MAPVSVLLVDDNTTFLRILENYMRAPQWHDKVRIVGTATNGEQALEKAVTYKPQVVVLDLVMPGLSGVQIIPRLKLALPQTWIIVLTLLDSPDYRRASLSAGADDFVAKETLDTDLRPAFARIKHLAAPSDSTPALAEIPTDNPTTPGVNPQDGDQPCDPIHS